MFRREGRYLRVAIEAIALKKQLAQSVAPSNAKSRAEEVLKINREI
jgi:hypothetical protein